MNDYKGGLTENELAKIKEILKKPPLEFCGASSRWIDITQTYRNSNDIIGPGGEIIGHIDTIPLGGKSIVEIERGYLPELQSI